MTALPLETTAGHAVRRFSAVRTAHRSFEIDVECDCGATFPGVPSVDIAGVSHVAIQVFFAHLAAAALPHVE